MADDKDNVAIAVTLINQKQPIYLAFHLHVACDCVSCKSNRLFLFTAFSRRIITISDQAKPYALQGAGDVLDTPK